MSEDNEPKYRLEFPSCAPPEWLTNETKVAPEGNLSPTARRSLPEGYMFAVEDHWYSDDGSSEEA